MGRGRSKVGSRETTRTQSNRGKPNDATEWYVSGEGMWINQYLRGRGDFGELSESEKQAIRDLDTATDGKISDDVLYRSVDATAIFGRMDDFDFGNMRNVILYGDNVFGKGAYAQGLAQKEKNRIQNVIDKEITEKGFMSTTASEDVAANWSDFTGSTRPVVLKIQTNGKARGVDLSGYDRNVDADEAQHERLLARNQKYKVKRVYGKNGHVYVDVEMR